MSENIISLSTITQGGYVSVMKGSEPIIIPVNDPIKTYSSPVSIIRNQEKTEIFGRIWSPEEQYALFLQNLKKSAEEYLGESVAEAIISVPGHFSYLQRQAVRDAAAIAGMTAIRLISEATSIAIYYYNKNLGTNFIISIVITDNLIDLTALHCEIGVLEVLAERTGNTSNNVGNDVWLLIQSVMSNENTFEIDDISEILINGAYSVYQDISTYLQDYFSHAEFVYMQNEYIALGAAYMCGKLAGNTACSDFLLLDVVHNTISIATTGGNSTKILAKDSTIPTKKAQIFTTSEDNLSAVDIWVYEGENPLAIDNTKIGYLRLTNIEPAQKEEPDIEISFEIDANGIIDVSAKNLQTDFAVKANLISSYLTEEEIEKSRLFLETWHTENNNTQQKKDFENKKVDNSFEKPDCFTSNTERQVNSDFEDGAKSILLQFLPVIDSLERALEISSKDPHADSYAQGMSIPGR